jgi:hypothetical protein
MRNSIFWDITPCSPLKVNRRFEGTYRLHLHGWRKCEARNNAWKKAPPKRWLTSNGLHGIISEGTEIFRKYISYEFSSLRNGNEIYGTWFLDIIEFIPNAVLYGVWCLSSERLLQRQLSLQCGISRFQKQGYGLKPERQNCYVGTIIPKDPNHGGKYCNWCGRNATIILQVKLRLTCSAYWKARKRR